MDLLRPTVFLRPKTISKIAIIKTKSEAIAFFLLLLALSFSPFLFVRLCDFGAYRVQKTCLLTPLLLSDCKFSLG